MEFKVDWVLCKYDHTQVTACLNTHIDQASIRETSWTFPSESHK